VASVVPARYFGPATAEFQSWLQKETRNFLEADLLHREYPPARKDALNEPREDRARVDGIEHDEDGPDGDLGDFDVAAVRSDLAKMGDPEERAMGQALLDVVKDLPSSDQEFLVRMADAKGASGADRTRLSRLRRKIKHSM